MKDMLGNWRELLVIFLFNPLSMLIWAISSILIVAMLTGNL